MNLRAASAFLLLAMAPLAAAPTSEWAKVGPTGALVYRADAQGNTIPDYSRAGYGGGGVRLPEVAVRVTLESQAEGDDGARIQAAIDEVGKLAADDQGLRGAVLLRAGTYRVAKSLALRAGGVVLRGEEGTTIVATGKDKRTLIGVGDNRARRALVGQPTKVVEAYVPWSATQLTVESAAGLKVGERVLVCRPSTAEWIHELGMDRIKNRPGAKEGETKQWTPAGFDLEIERTITAIAGNQLTLDAPVMIALDAKFGGATVSRFTLPRIKECGLERLRLVSEYAKGRETQDEDHSLIAVELHAVENAWVRDVTMAHFSFGVQANGNSIFVTLQDSQHLDPVSQITGSRRYSFHLNGQYGLVLRCHAKESRHSFVTGARVRGPNVFLEGTAVKSHADTGPHHRWAIGSLYDNVSDDNQIRVQDRQWAGSGHGWAGAQHVLWNCTSKTLVVQQPPTAQNYAIGCVGKFVAGDWSPQAARGVIDSAGTPVSPRSLYLAQLEARLGKTAVANIAARPSR